jgi:hypothetical protein
MDLLDYPFIVGGAIGGLPILLIAFLAWRGRRNMYRTLSSTQGYKLRYCSESRFNKWWKFFPWEGIGILSVSDQALVFEGLPNQGDAFRAEAKINQLELHGRRHWLKNGLLPWLFLKSEPNSYYLCVETGPLIFGADRKTRDLFSAIKFQAEVVDPKLPKVPVSNSESSVRDSED